MSGRVRPDVFRWREWSAPVRPVTREVLTSQPATDGLGRVDTTRAPLLFVPGFGHGAWAFAEHWLEHSAERGYPAYAMSLRGHGESGSAPGTTLRAYTHDVVQVAARLPRQAVLIGHGLGALAVAQAMARYPARAAVLVAPVFGGPVTLGTALWRNPAGTLPAIFGGQVRLRRGQLFGSELAAGPAKAYAARVNAVTPQRVAWQLLVHRRIETPVGDPPVLVVGSSDDRIVPRRSLEKVARRYGGAPLLFPGMGHDLMLDARWSEPIDAILDWLEKSL